jgi:hypothetical protein
MKTQSEIRRAFWESHPELDRIARNRRTRSKGQNAQNADTRCAFVDYVDHLARNGDISANLAHNVTL